MRHRFKPAFIEAEDGSFVANDDSAEAKQARARRRRLAKLQRLDRQREALELLTLAQRTVPPS